MTEHPEKRLLTAEEMLTKSIQNNLDLPRFYANNAGLNITQWDVRLVFGEIVGKEDEGRKGLIEPKVAVSISLHLAKALGEMLTKNIERYEETFGKINLPEAKDQEKEALPSPTASAE